jgi:hypothetical protein
VPRGTADVDVNVFVSEERVPDAVAILSTLGIDISTDAPEQARERGMFVGRCTRRWDDITMRYAGR